MVGARNPFFVDRSVYTYRGKWQNPNEDKPTTFYYFISNPMTLVSSFNKGREELVQEIEITVFGEFPFCEKDIITLANGEQFYITNMTLNYFEPNLAIRDMVKQRVSSMVLTLR